MASAAEGLPPQVVAAIWSVVLGAIVAGATWLFRLYEADRTTRVARLRALVALRAEIESKRAAQRNNFDVHTVDDLCRRMAQDAAYVPHVPLDDYRTYVLELIGDNLLHLPRFAVRHVVAYYEWDRVVHHAFVHLASAEFAALAPDRRIMTWRAIPAMTVEHQRRSRIAIRALRRYERLDGASLAACRRRWRRSARFWWPRDR